MKTFFELIVIASTLFIFVACNQSVANENTEGATAELSSKIPTAVAETPPTTEEENTLPKTAMTFSEMTHDFGVIEEGDKVTHVFTFQNTGDEPLIINKAKGSCGCTVPSFSKEPIPPGGSGEMEVVFNSKGKTGNQTKTVTINANTDPNPTRLTIKAEVKKME